MFNVQMVPQALLAAKMQRGCNFHENRIVDFQAILSTLGCPFYVSHFHTSFALKSFQYANIRPRSKTLHHVFIGDSAQCKAAKSRKNYIKPTACS